LIVSVAALGIAPSWVSNMISNSMEVISQRILQYI
jgi:NADH-quinone oxidoreductase subunit M